MSVLPEPANCWIRRRPGVWNVGPTSWCDLGTGSLGEIGREFELPELPPVEGGTVYVPPVRSDLRPELDQRLGVWLEAGGTAVIQRLIGDDLWESGDALVIWDLTPALLQGELERVGSLPNGGAALWPLIGGLTDDPELWEKGCRALEGAGVTALLGVALELDGRQRRGLIESLGGGFETVFHRPTPNPRDFAAVAWEYGLRPFPPRHTHGSRRRQRNQQAAELLALAGEACMASEAQTQELFRAARWIEDTPVDVRALALEGNLLIVEQIGPLALQVLMEWSENEDAAVTGWLRKFARGSEERT